MTVHRIMYVCTFCADNSSEMCGGPMTHMTKAQGDIIIFMVGLIAGSLLVHAILQ